MPKIMMMIMMIVYGLPFGGRVHGSNLGLENGYPNSGFS
jgi:hypothetical protein